MIAVTLLILILLAISVQNINSSWTDYMHPLMMTEHTVQVFYNNDQKGLHFHSLSMVGPTHSKLLF